MRSMKCPGCGADVEIDDQGREYGFCQYCGTKIDLTDYRTHHTKRIIDEAKIQKVNAEKEIELYKLKSADAKTERRKIRILSIFAIPLLGVILYLTWVIFKNNEDLAWFLGLELILGGSAIAYGIVGDDEPSIPEIETPINGIYLPDSIFPLQKYTPVEIEKELKKAGFSDIYHKKVKDIGLVDLRRLNGKVSDVLINGESYFTDARYDRASHIEILYHSK